MIIRTVVVTPFMQNARVIIDENTREAVVMDPGGEIDRILDALRLEDSIAPVSKIFLTHAHIDHAGGVEALRDELEKLQGSRPPLLAHRAEQSLRGSVIQQALMFGLSSADYRNVPEPEKYLEDGDEVSVGNSVGKVLFTPGHSPGHIAWYFPKQQFALVDYGLPGEVPSQRTFFAGVVFAGDTLFAGSIGRTDLPGGDHGTLLASIRNKLFVLPGDTLVLPGHGGETIIEVEKETNPFF